MAGSTITPERSKRAEAEMHHWIVVARRMIHEDFTGNEAELQRQIMQTACTLMLQDRMGQVQNSLDEIKTALQPREGSY